MYGSDLTIFSFCWIIPLLMMILCFLMMRGKKGAMMCGFGPRSFRDNQTSDADAAVEILDKRYASGEINKDEYREMKRQLTGSINDTLNA